MRLFLFIILVVSQPVYTAQYDELIKLGEVKALVYHPPLYQKNKPQRWPAILFAHGFVGSAISQDMLLALLAKDGFLVIAIEHRDPVAFERIPPDKPDPRWKVIKYLKRHPFNNKDYAYRPQEFRQFAREAVNKLPVDRKRIIFAGHSMGGFSIFNAAQDSAIKPLALIGYSVGELNFKRDRHYFSKEQLAGMSIPLMLFYGEKEFNSENGSHAEFIRKHYGGNSRLIMIDGGTHLSYTNPTRVMGRKQRLEHINLIHTRTREFLQTVLN